MKVRKIVVLITLSYALHTQAMLVPASDDRSAGQQCMYSTRIFFAAVGSVVSQVPIKIQEKYRQWKARRAARRQQRTRQQTPPWERDLMEELKQNWFKDKRD